MQKFANERNVCYIGGINVSGIARGTFFAMMRHISQISGIIVFFRSIRGVIIKAVGRSIKKGLVRGSQHRH